MLPSGDGELLLVVVVVVGVFPPEPPGIKPATVPMRLCGAGSGAAATDATRTARMVE